MRQEGAAQPAARECPQGYQQDAEKEALRMENFVKVTSNVLNRSTGHKEKSSNVSRILSKQRGNSSKTLSCNSTN
eukprot:2220698-Amphidinium_carterae.1